jgi:transcriptional regulator with XRE-family HTH domain
MTLGEKLFNARKSKGFTQEDLAEFSQLNLRTIQRIENNKTFPHGKSLELICKALDLKVDELLVGMKSSEKRSYWELAVNGLFLLVVNIIEMTIFGFLTLESDANLNSRLGALLLAVLLPLFIVLKTKEMGGIERMMKFGAGLIVYFILVLLKPGFHAGLGTFLFPVIIIFLAILFYGRILNKMFE